jgi:predicted HTH domain antitoxin
MQNTRRLTCVKDSGTIMPLVIDYPPLLPDVLQQTSEEFEREAKMAMAVKLFKMKRLSSGMAARLAGMERVSFLLDLHRYGVAMIDLDEAELQSDMDNA